jgi:hypothetical protein
MGASDKELVKAFIAECKQEQEWKKRWESNHIQFENYFKYSGKVEQDKILISHWKYDYDHKSNDIHEQFIKIKDYEKSKENTSKLTKENSAQYWNEAANRLWGDKE